MQILIHKESEETSIRENSTELFANVRGKYVTWAWQFESGEIYDSDDVEDGVAYRVRGEVYDDSDAAAEVLRKEFWEMARECGGAEYVETLKNDRPARAEAFNNWTDALCKDGEICDDVYSQCGIDD